MYVNWSWTFFSDPLLLPCVFNTEMIFRLEGLEMEECVGTGSKGRELGELRLSVRPSVCRLRRQVNDHQLLSSSSSFLISSELLLESSGSISRMS